MAVELAAELVEIQPNKTEEVKLEYHEVLNRLPFGRGWLLLDEVTISADREVVRGVFHYTPWGNFRDHFAGEKGLPMIMPGVLNPEIINQLAGCLLADEEFISDYPELVDKVFVLTDIFDYKFRGVVEAGDILTIEVGRPEVRRNFVTYTGTATNQRGEFVSKGSCRLVAINPKPVIAIV